MMERKFTDDEIVTECLKRARAEAIKEFAERLKEKLQLNRMVIGYNGAFVEAVQIDNLVKEMTAGVANPTDHRKA